jgi:hypothetical protein
MLDKLSDVLKKALEFCDCFAIFPVRRPTFCFFNGLLDLIYSLFQALTLTEVAKLGK